MTVPSSMGHLLDALADLRVLVVGDAMLDTYLEGQPGRLCREAPVPVVVLQDRRDVPGGAANTAVNVVDMGAQATLLSVVGADAHGEVLGTALSGAGVEVDLVPAAGRGTVVGSRVLASGQMLVRFDQGTTTTLDPGTEAELLTRLEAAWAHHDAVIVSDYDHGVCTPNLQAALARLQTHLPRIVVVDAKHPARYRRVRPTAVKPNYEEAVELLGPPQAVDGDRIGAVNAAGERVLERTGARIAAVTLDADGALVFEHGRPPYRTYARPVARPRVSGAGDTFTAVLTLAVAAGATASAAAELASAASALVVAKDGTATCSAAELRAHLAADDRRLDAAQLQVRAAVHHQAGRRIVFTNGCFDLLHRGHVDHLNAAKALGDVLVVAVNADDSVRRLRGPGNPRTPLVDRVEVLAALSCIDHIVTFDGDTPVELIEAVRPDVYVKGGDHTRENLPEVPVVEQLGGQVRILPSFEEPPGPVRHTAEPAPAQEPGVMATAP